MDNDHEDYDEEIPPDTQLNNDQQQIHQKQSLIQENEKGDEEVEEEDVELGVQQKPLNSLIEDNQLNVQQQYQFTQDGQLYEVNEEGKIFKVTIEIQNGQEVQILEQVGGPEEEIAQPIFQNINGTQPYQQINQNQKIQENQFINNSYEPFQEYGQKSQYQISQYYPGNYQTKKEQNFAQIQNNFPINTNQLDYSFPKKKVEGHLNKKEPTDSVPKFQKNKGKSMKNLNVNQKIFMNRNKYMENNINNQFYKYEMNKSENHLFPFNKNIMSLKNLNNMNYRKNNECIDIPREEYDNYEHKETLVMNSGMDIGEYQIIGSKTSLEEKVDPDYCKVYNNEEEIIKKLNRSNKAPVKRRNKINFHIIDKYYTLTESNPKTLQYSENNIIESQNKNNYTSLNSNYNKNNNNISNNKYLNSKLNSKNNNNLYNISNINKLKVSTKYRNNNYGMSNFKFVNLKSRNYKRGDNDNIDLRNYLSFNKGISKKNMLINMKQNFKNSIASMPSDNFSRYLLEQINKIRKEPESFIGVIEDAIDNITKDRFGRLIYNGKMKIALAQGKSAFLDAIKYLKNINPMKPLNYVSDLTVIPPQNEKEIKDKNDLKRKVGEMINSGINIKSFWRDVIKDPEICFLLMIVDDSGIKSGMKRKDILNPKMKFIGISSVEINKNFVCYITLGY